MIECLNTVHLDTLSPAEERINPVWHKTYQVKCAIGIYSAITDWAKEINETKFARFFALAQQHAVDEAIVSLCTLYDSSKGRKDEETNERSERHTIKSLRTYLGLNLPNRDLSSIRLEHLTSLGIDQIDADQILKEPSASGLTDKAKDRLKKLLEAKTPTERNDTQLRKIFEHRNRVVAHHEIVNVLEKEKLKVICHLEDMERLNAWAISFCELVYEAFGHSSPSSCFCAKMATYNVILKALGKDNLSDKEYIALINEKMGCPPARA